MKEERMLLTMPGSRSKQERHLEHASQCENQPTSGAHQENGCDVQAEGYKGVGQQNEGTYACHLVKRRPALREWDDCHVDDGADGRVVV